MQTALRAKILKQNLMEKKRKRVSYQVFQVLSQKYLPEEDLANYLTRNSNGQV